MPRARGRRVPGLGEPALVQGLVQGARAAAVGRCVVPWGAQPRASTHSPVQTRSCVQTHAQPSCKRASVQACALVHRPQCCVSMHSPVQAPSHVQVHTQPSCQHISVCASTVQALPTALHEHTQSPCKPDPTCKCTPSPTQAHGAVQTPPTVRRDHTQTHVQTHAPGSCKLPPTSSPSASRVLAANAQPAPVQAQSHVRVHSGLAQALSHV